VLLLGQFTISSNSEPIAVNGSNPPSHFVNPKEGFVAPSHLVNTPLSPTLNHSVNPAELSGSPTIPTQPPIQSNPDLDVSPSSPSNTITPTPQRVIELIADRQDYDAERQVVTAAGAVTMKFGDSVLVSDYLQINLNEQLAVATGKVTLTRQDQILQGKRLEYNYLQDRGRVLNGRGSINLQTANSDFSSNQPKDSQTGVFPDLALSSRLTRNQPFAGSSSLVVDSSSKLGTTTTPTNQASTRPQAITSSGDLSFTAGLGSNYADTSGDGGGINRLRYEAEQVDFNADGWDAINVRVTNDPFSPQNLNYARTGLSW
jgi:lipopolysaccharide export system protein LptA